MNSAGLLDYLSGADADSCDRARTSAERDLVFERIASMLAQSYAIGESPENWWRTFSAYYHHLEMEPSIRTAVDIGLDWLFCQRGETAWHGIRAAIIDDEKKPGLLREGKFPTQPWKRRCNPRPGKSPVLGRTHRHKGTA